MTNATASRLPADWIDRLRLPAIAAPMFLVSGPEMVLAACRGGMIGAMPAANARTPEDLAPMLDSLAGGLDRARAGGERPAPWALAVTTHSSSTRLAADLALVARYRPPLVITAMGSPRPAIEVVHGYGGLVFADVSTPDYARKAVDAGADGLILVCAGAGGHTGQIAAPAFLRAVRSFFDGIVVLGGAVSDGAAIRAAQVMGADLAHVGTRLIACEESLAVPAYKQMVIEAEARDLVLTDLLTGAPSHQLRRSLEAAGLDPDALARGEGFDLHYARNRPKAWKDIWSAGQGVGAVRAAEPLAQIIDTLADDYRAALLRAQSDVWARRHAEVGA